MAMIECKECGAMISEMANACPYCGYPNHAKKTVQPEIESSKTEEAPQSNEPQQPRSESEDRKSNRIESFITLYGDRFPKTVIPQMKSVLYGLPESKVDMLTLGVQYREPLPVFLFSLFLGSWGVDRFLLGHIVAGIFKLITWGGCGLWWFIDLFLIMDATRKENYEKFLHALG